MAFHRSHHSNDRTGGTHGDERPCSRSANTLRPTFLYLRAHAGVPGGTTTDTGPVRTRDSDRAPTPAYVAYGKGPDTL